LKLILKYLKPFAVLACIAVALLFIQNFADLALPNYMSEIVNVGIMRGGIRDAVPRAMSEDAYGLVIAFMSEDDKAQFESAYELAYPGSEESKRATEEFTALSEKPAYLLNVASDNEELINKLSLIYGKAVVSFSEYVKSGLGNQTGEGGDVNFAEMSIDEIYSMFDNLDRLAAEAAISQAQGTVFLHGAEMGITFTKQFYSELGANTKKIQTNSILNTGLKMFVVILIGVVATISVGFISARVSAGIGRRMRRDIFKKVESFSHTEIDRFSTASLITRSTNDVQQVQMFAMMGIRMLCSAPIMGIGGIVMAVNKSYSMSWIIAVAVVILMALQITLFSTVVPKFKLMQKLLDNLNRVSRENLTGLMVIRAFGNEEREESRFEKANREMRNTHRFVERMMALMDPTLSFLMGCFTLLIIWLGGKQVGLSKLMLGDMLAFMQYATQIIMAFLMIAMMFMMVPRALVSAGRIREVLDTEPEITDGKNLKTLGGRAKGRITFNNVSFKYRDAESCVISNVSFTAEAGKTTAFIGSTGSGKSTLVNLIPRFYDVTEGSIEIDGIDIRDISQEELRRNIGYVPQKGVLFSGDIGSNMRYGKEEATEEEIRESIRVAQAEDFVFHQKEGLSSEIAQGGDNVSGGQKQRLSIARALVKNPPIYIFDDSFSALDYKTDAALRSALHNYTSDATVLIVAQRVSTIMNADQIIVLDDGRIVGRGTHSELLKTCEEYREIAESQLSKEELA
jgi:ATP-binding cassette subfamily B protein